MYKNILVPIDLGDESSWRHAVPTAVEYARTFGSKLHVMTVVPSFKMPLVASYFPKDFERQAHERLSQEMLGFMSEKVPAELNAQHHVGLGGPIYEVILKTAKRLEVDLIIIGSHRPELRDYLIGPNASRVVRHFPHSVLVARD